MNTIGNNPVTTKDVQLAEKIFGKDIGALKGKTTRQQPDHVINSMIEIPRILNKSQQNVTVCIDGMKVSGLSFLMMIAQNLYYQTPQYIKCIAIQ